MIPAAITEAMVIILAAVVMLPRVFMAMVTVRAMAHLPSNPPVTATDIATEGAVTTPDPSGAATDAVERSRQDVTMRGPMHYGKSVWGPPGGRWWNSSLMANISEKPRTS